MTETQRSSTESRAEAFEAEDRIREAEWNAERVWRRLRYPVITAINLTVFFILWEIGARAAPDFMQIYFPLFTDVLENLRIGWFGGSGDEAGSAINLLQDFVIAKNFWVTVKVYAAGTVVAVAVGIPIGLLMGASKWADAILSPYVWTLSSLPRIAIFPILILVMGLGDPIKYALVFLTALFPVLINTWAGVKTTDRSLVNAARVFGANRVQIYQKVVLPYTLPFVVTGVQLGLSRGLIGVVIAEFLTGATVDGGLGWLLFRSARTFNSSLTYASLLTLAVFALVMVQGTRSMEAKIAPWRQVSNA